MIAILINVLTILGVIVDAFNLPSRIIGSIVSNINIEFWGVLISPLLTFDLFVFTYLMIDKKQVEKEKNKKQYSDMLLYYLYQDYQETMNLLEQDIVKKKIPQMVNFNSVPRDDSFVNAMTRNAENIYHSLTPFITDGVISSKKVQLLYRIRKNFMSYVNLSVTFFDHPEVYSNAKNKLDEDIKYARDMLKYKSQ